MDTLVALILGFYLLFESFTAINEMPKIRLRCVLHEFKNVYTMKYIIMGIYGIVVASHANLIHGWYVLLIVPSTFCVLGRTIYRLRHSTLPHIQYMITRLKFNRARHYKRHKS